MTRTERNICVAAGAVAGAVGVWALFKLLWQEEEDRPPILVNNGSIRFTIDPTASGQLLDWTPAGGNWKPNHPNGRKVTDFRVTFTGSGAGGCGPLTGPVVRIAFERETFIVHKHGNHEPGVSPRNRLVHDLRTRSLSFGTPESGMITEVHVPGPGGGTCVPTSRDVQVKIRPLP